MSTFSQMYIHLIFAVKGRESLIDPSWEEELFKYITGIVTNKEQKLIAINGVANHIHILIGMKPSCRLSDLVREIKKSTNLFIEEKRFTKFKFEWQEGYGAFTYSHSSLNNIISYINKQKEHHKKMTFREEYLSFLEKFDVQYQDKYLFKFVDCEKE